MRSNGGGDKPFKYCDNCGNSNAVHVLECAECGWQFPPHTPRTHGITAGDASPIAESQPPKETWFEVLHVGYHKHQKGDKPPTLRIDYDIGEMYPVSEWKCFEHSGFALQKACEWWASTVGGSVPFSIDDVISVLSSTSHKMPRTILCTKESGDKYWQVKDKGKFYDCVPQSITPITPPYPAQTVTDDDIPF